MMPSKQRLVFWAALLAIPLAFFLALEAGLRLAGFGDDMRLFVQTQSGGMDYYAMNPGVVRRYFSDPDFGTYTSRDRFLVQKPPDALRVFCLGASTTVGYPYMFNGAYSTLIRERLENRFPDRHIEVVNLGITAVNSFTVAELGKEVLRYRPDVLLLYFGHNEFYGALGVGSSEYAGGSRFGVRVYLALQRLRTLQLLRRGITAAGSLFRTEGDAPWQLMERMARDRHIRMTSDAHAEARDYFRSNYDELVRAAKAEGVALLASTLAGNLRDQPPFVSLHGETVTADDRAAWEELFRRGRALADGGDCGKAAELYRAALRLDDQRADGRYFLARCLDRLEQYVEARLEYVQARDLDALPFRARREFNDIIRDVAAASDIPIVHMDSVFSAASPQGIPGANLFWEHVHPTFEGYFLMAKAFVEAMESHGLGASLDAWRTSPEIGDAFYRKWSALTEFDHEVARLRIEILTSRWPFRTEPAELTYQPESMVQKAAWDNVRGLTSWAASHEALAQAFAENDDLESASAHLWALARMTPYDPAFHVRTADLLARQRRFEDAAYVYERALRIAPSTQIHARLGMVVYQLRAFPRAITHLEKALEGELDSGLQAQIHTLLATAYINTSDRENAARHVDRLERMVPSAPQVAALRTALDKMP